MHGPDPLSKLYTRSFFRATWITTALDAGFFSAMNLKPKWLRDFVSFVLSLVYLMYPNAAEEKVNRYRQNPTVDILRIAWEKSENPYLWLFALPSRGFLKIRRNIEIPLPRNQSPSVFKKEKKSVKARLYFDGSEAKLSECNKLIFQIHGGGFVAVSPENHDEYVSNWARQTKVPIVCINYGKAPENPYPWAIEECFEAYKSIVESNGRVIGLKGWNSSKNNPIKIVLVGDSAGGCLVTCLTIKLIQDGQIHMPSGILLIYPFLHYDLKCWMPQDQVDILKTDSHVELSEFIKSKTLVNKLAPLSIDEAPKSVDILTDKVDKSPSFFERFKPQSFRAKPGPYIHSYLSMTSRMHYHSDRVLNTGYMKAMSIFYLAESPLVPDLENDYFLSPVNTPEEILSQFPKTMMICGEKDPLVDDTIIFANRLRDAKRKAHHEWERVKDRMDSPNREFKNHIFSRNPEDMVHVKILPGISHGFFQMYSIFPEAVVATQLTSEWFKQLFSELDAPHDKKLTEMMTTEMKMIDEASLLQRRRVDMAAGIFTSKKS